MITKQQAEQDYELLKNQAISSFKKNKFETALSNIINASKLAYHINFKYSDFEFENLLNLMSIIIIKKRQFVPNNRYVFYDCFALSNRNLTQQYIRAFMAWNIEFLLIIINGQADIDPRILAELQGYDKASVFFVPQKGISLIDQARLIAEKINDYAPSKAFLQMTPWDVVGCLVWNAFPNVERYQINLTDHAFWIGIQCVDYVLEFRNYGYNISFQYRGIAQSRLLIQPYYPIMDSPPFQGITRTGESSIVKLFSGGAPYKVYGAEGLFLNMVKRLLTENSNTIFYYAGGGNMIPMQNFIDANNLRNRWILLGNRKDIVEVMKAIDIYIGTYPWGGGLMSLIAAACEKPIVSFVDSFSKHNNVEGLFSMTKNLPQISYKDLEEFYSAVNVLIKNSVLRKEMGKTLRDAVLSPSEFNSNLKQLIMTKENKENISFMQIDTDNFCQLYINTENQFLHVYKRVLINKTFALKKPIKFISAIFEYIYYKDKLLLIKKIKSEIIQRLNL